VELTARQAEVKLQARWSKATTGDPFAKMELETRRPEADPDSRVE